MEKSATKKKRPPRLLWKYAPIALLTSTLLGSSIGLAIVILMPLNFSFEAPLFMNIQPLVTAPLFIHVMYQIEPKCVRRILLIHLLASGPFIGLAIALGGL